ncbi:hypothetical protein VB715_19560 [Crocosphaera sp. UHCC 0190]|uniref:hypothetical protein n=1 Tax=Crocosphaera sp. UHCC 0190 TaxID=3110246 RepID=UPI002B1F61F6|nr:hypothetical protein [Crocosphaera sp. UHCC 0190]MEA5511974.1 hypothetical protein [Crocosphaera sp. UHCC 0190]
MVRLNNGVTIDPETKRFLPTDKEKTKVLGVRLPISMIEKINQLPDKSDWLKQVIGEALEDRLSA